MKQLILIRHGKSDWGNSHLSDFDRPLNARGHRNAPEMAQRILDKDQVPQLLVSSPALRALTTAKHFAQVWQIPADQIQTDMGIYNANAIALLKIVNRFDNQYDSIAVFGHNPGFTDLANYISDADIYDLPTCGIVSLAFYTEDWAEIGSGNGTLLDFDTPKGLSED